jgi:hypothetical protein
LEESIRHMKKEPYLAEAAAFVHQTRALATMEDALTLLRDFRASWDRRFGHLRDADDAVLSCAPDVLEQLYDCAQDLANLHGDGDALAVLQTLETYMSWESDEARKPFQMHRGCRKLIIDYSF